MTAQADSSADEEQSIWQGHPSQIIRGHVYLLCGLAAGALVGTAVLLRAQLGSITYAVAAAALIPLLIGGVKWMQTQCRRYELTTERLRVRQGVFSRRTDEVELYRVKDYTLVEPFFLRLFGLGNLLVNTSDVSNPSVLIEAIPDAPAVRDQVRKHVEMCRVKKGVRVAEIE
jgi:uncharacterized membrane protein YdbT with pleckstrin-like domain